MSNDEQNNEHCETYSDDNDDFDTTELSHPFFAWRENLENIERRKTTMEKKARSLKIIR